MKTALLFPALALLGISSFKPSTSFSCETIWRTDTAGINHNLDGSPKEWPDAAFTRDDGAGISYAIDNDAKDLFLVITVADFRSQLKMMRQGMNLYIDLKGKKKEGRGIEFPVTNETNQDFNIAKSNTQNSEGTETEEQKKADLKAIRIMMAVNLVEIKLFGFGDSPDGQQLKLPGSANVAFAWDADNVMCIEYRIPLSLLGETASLDKKDISIGWKIKAFQAPARENAGATEENPASGHGGRGGGGGGGRGGYSRGGRSGNSSGQSSNKPSMMDEQKVWAKYTITIPAMKGF